MNLKEMSLNDLYHSLWKLRAKNEFMDSEEYDILAEIKAREKEDRDR